MILKLICDYLFIGLIHRQLMSKNSVSGASDMLTVCITNDLAVKRRKRSRSVPRSGSVNNFARKYIDFNMKIKISNIFIIWKIWKLGVLKNETNDSRIKWCDHVKGMGNWD